MRVVAYAVFGAFATEHLSTLLTRTGLKTSLIMTYQDLGLNKVAELASHYLGRFT
ncbi:MAG: hypothetical protein KKF56_01810 [Nanoarchaeota archaeon]|nr:hypothetical protein [Nanoarchaeota archaeon]